jgi:hypothetical protein
LAFQKWTGEGTIYLTDLQAGINNISSPAPFTNSEGRYRLSAWTADSKTLIYTAKWHRKWGIYKRALAEDVPTPIVPSLPNYYSVIPDENLRALAHTDPNHSLVFYVIVDRRSGAAQSLLMRVPIEGGTPELVLTGHLY